MKYLSSKYIRRHFNIYNMKSSLPTKLCNISSLFHKLKATSDGWSDCYCFLKSLTFMRWILWNRWNQRHGWWYLVVNFSFSMLNFFFRCSDTDSLVLLFRRNITKTKNINFFCNLDNSSSVDTLNIKLNYIFSTKTKDITFFW